MWRSKKLPFHFVSWLLAGFFFICISCPILYIRRSRTKTIQVTAVLGVINVIFKKHLEKIWTQHDITGFPIFFWQLAAKQATTSETSFKSSAIKIWNKIPLPKKNHSELFFYKRKTSPPLPLGLLMHLTAVRGKNLIAAAFSISATADLVWSQPFLVWKITVPILQLWEFVMGENQ